MIPFDAPTVFVGWAAGCLWWQIVVGATRPVTFGARWPIRVFVVVLGVLALVSAGIGGFDAGRDIATVVLVIVAAAAIAVSIVDHRRHRAVVGPPAEGGDSVSPVADRLDVVAAVAGVVGLVVGIQAAGGPVGLAFVRGIVGAAALGGLTFAMVFGHRLLAKPYLGLDPLDVATTALLALWPLETLAVVWPTGVVSVLTGAIDDGYMGILGWMWLCCAAATAGLLVAARVILADRVESKPAAATGMLYLAGLTGAGAVLIARAVLSG